MRKKVYLTILIILPFLLSLTAIMIYNNKKVASSIDMASTKQINSVDSQLATNPEKRYQKYVSNFSTIQPNKLDNIKEHETVYLYFGRATCSYCRAFVPELASISQKKGVTIYYIDTENTDTDKEIQSLREKYNIEFVPSLIKIEQGDSNTFKSYDTKSDSNELEKFLSKKR